MQHTALLVIDLQRGAFDGERIAPIAHADALIGRARTLVDAARAGGVPIVFVQHCADAGDPFEEGSVHGRLHAELVPAAGDAVVAKHASSAFEGTDLGARLQALGATQVVVCGLQSEFCISNTSRSALAEGLSLVVAEDAHGTWPSEGRSAEAISAEVNRDLAAQGARLMSTASLAGALARRSAST